MKKLTKKIMIDAAKFSNFAQKFKMIYWNTTQPLTTIPPEEHLDKVALELWEWLQKTK